MMLPLLYKIELINLYYDINQVNSTCRQSSAVTIIRGHLDLQASSNGKKYLSASIKGCFPLGGGRADDGLSSLQIRTNKCQVKCSFALLYYNNTFCTAYRDFQILTKWSIVGFLALNLIQTALTCAETTTCSAVHNYMCMWHKLSSPPHPI